MTYKIKLDREKLNKLETRINRYLNANPPSLTYITVHPDDFFGCLYLREKDRIPAVGIKILGGEMR